tara:strand:+ start:288 stop:662 length:375 start_codon:yes stop_codon:yes gene_type:complete
MLDQRDIRTKIQTVERALQVKLGVRGRDLAHTLRRAGRRLPSRVRKQGAILAQAEFMACNPKLARQIDVAPVHTAFIKVITHLNEIDVGKRRMDRLLGIAGTIAFNVLVIIVAFIVFLWWQGYV